MWCPDWPVVALGRDADAEVVVVHANRVVACSPAARRAGVQRGLRRREAQRRCATLEVLERDEASEARVFEAVVAALDDLTPRVEVIRPGMVVFASRGPSRYFGGDEFMARRCIELVAAVLGADPTSGAAGSRVGVADAMFAASLAARQADHRGVMVVEPGATPAFLAPLPVRTLERPELTSVLERLGLATLGQFAALTRTDVVGRFGAEGEEAHRLASGLDARPPAVSDPPPDMEVAADLDPPIDRIDQAAFMGKVLADQFLGRLDARGATCTRVIIGAETGGGERYERCWRHEGTLTAPAVADRIRWQLDGWLHGSNRRVTRADEAALVRLWVRPEDLVAARGRQLGFWGGQHEGAERVARTVARLQAMLGPDAVRAPQRRGGRSPHERIITVAADTVDLHRSSVDPHGGSGLDAFDGPWPGVLPAPSPSQVHRVPVEAAVVDRRGVAVVVDARALLSEAPYQASVGGDRWLEIVAWAGPWPLDERWWDAARRHRGARLQLVTDDHVARLLTARGGRWWVEATYD